jgi:hypothetical protein
MAHHWMASIATTEEDSSNTIVQGNQADCLDQVVNGVLEPGCSNVFTIEVV